MLKKLVSLLRQIVGRIKKYMSAYYLTFGAIFTPTAFVYYLETHNALFSSLIFLIGMLSVLWGSIEIKRENKRDLEILKAQFKTQEIIEENTSNRHKELITEIQKLRGEISESKKRNNKRKPSL
jgi:hypothetical protein